MANQTSRFNKFLHDPVITISNRMVKAVLLGLLLLAAIFGLAQAAGSASPTDQGGLPNCGDDPACGYIQMHANDSGISWVVLGCNSEPICGYIQMHNVTVSASFAQVLAAQPPVSAYNPHLVVSRTTLVRSGPHANAFSYGELPTNFVTSVVGTNQDTSWWVIPLPLTLSPDGLGWVNASSVNVNNATFVANELANCDSLTICDYINAHTARAISVLEPAYAVEVMMNQPLIALTGE